MNQKQIGIFSRIKKSDQFDKYDQVGLSAHRDLNPKLFRLAHHVEVKKITEEEVLYYRRITDSPLYFHLQYTGDNRYYLPSAMSLKPFLKDIEKAYHSGQPEYVSIHFGPASRSITLDSNNYIAVADGPLLNKKELVSNLTENLELLKETFPGSKLLVENLEFVPEIISGGSYRYIQEANFFSEYVMKWKETGILDGIIFDVAHGLIAAANHPLYNGLLADPLETGPDYIEKLRRRSEDIIQYFTAYLSSMPIQLVKEIHVSGISRLSEGVWVDAHIEIGPREMSALGKLLNMLGERNIPITLEYYRSSQKALEQLEMLHRMLMAITKDHQGDSHV